jgi:hypothetical protein
LHLQYDSLIFQIYLYDDEAITTRDLNKDIVALLQLLITFFSDIVYRRFYFHVLMLISLVVCLQRLCGANASRLPPVHSHGTEIKEPFYF